MGQAAAAHQLIAGFYESGPNDWRWTSRQFAVVLLPPKGADKSGATLRVKLYIPEPEIKTLGPMTLSADVGEYSLASQTFSKPGSWEYERDVPSALIPADRLLLPIIFHFDRALAPWQADGRELGAVVSEISLE